MRIEIQNKPLAEAEVGMDGFKKVLKETLNLKKAIEDNLTIKHSELTEDVLKRHIYLGMNWGEIIDMIPYREEQKVMRIKALPLTAYDMTKLKPGTTTPNRSEFEFMEERIKEQKDMILINDYVALSNANIKNWLDNQHFEYGETKWTPKIQVNLK